MFLAILLAASAAQGLPAPERARDPFVFRSVLDQRARMVTLALNDDLWLAYDAQTCALYKAWKGGVKFDGAVYTTVHGPQPTSRGVAYTEEVEGPAWSAELGGKALGVHPAYEGYSIDNGRAMLRWRLDLDDGRAVHVEEHSEFVRPEHLFPAERLEELGLTAGDPGLIRTLRSFDLPEGVAVRLLARTDGTRGPKLCESCDREKLIDEKDASGKVVATKILSNVVLTKERSVTRLITFFEPRAAAKGGAK